MQLRKIVMGSVAAAAALVAQAPAHAWTQNAHYWMSVGVFSRFNVVTRDDFKAKTPTCNAVLRPVAMPT